MVDISYLLGGLLLLPLVGSAASLLMGRRQGAHWPVVLALALSWLCAVTLCVQQVMTSRSVELTLGTVLQSGSLQLRLGFLIDPLSVILMTTMTTVTLAGLLYYAGSVRPILTKTAGKRSTTPAGQIGGDETVGGAYAALIGAVLFSALLAVSANDYFTLFAGWEGVAIGTWLLMSWRTQRLGATTFAIHRFGSAALVLSILLLLAHAGSIDFSGLRELSATGEEPIPTFVWTSILLLLAVAAMVQTAQFPFHIWLEDGSPEHPATSVVVQAGLTVPVGLYLLLRSQHLFSHSADVALLATAVGLGGACIMALAAFAATDMARALAYSTASQASLIAAAALTTSAWGAVHLVTHSVAKCGLILGAAVVCRAVTSGGDLARMGGLRTHLPLAFSVFVVAAVVLSGMPPLFGFWEYAGMALAGHVWTQALLGLTLLLTSLYLWRLLWLVFLGKARSTTLRPTRGRETTRLATAVIIAISILVLSGGAAAILPLFAEGRNGLLAWGPLTPSLSSARLLNAALSHKIIIIATVGISLLGLAAVWLTHRRTGVQLHHEKGHGPLRRLLASGYYGTEGYELAMSCMRRFGRGLWTFVDTLFLDLLCSRGPAAVLATGGWLMARLHTGLIAWYLLAVVAAACLCTLWMVM